MSILILTFSLTTEIIKKLLYETKKERKNIKIKLDCIEMLMSQAIIDLQISHEEFKMIVDEKRDYDNQKQNIINKGDKSELSENIQVQKNNNLFLCIIKWLLLQKKHGEKMV